MTSIRTEANVLHPKHATHAMLSRGSIWRPTVALKEKGRPW
ncbi:uncharacterized protein FTOL_13842 [Fusarium torulosum]|uniref:Uncharacterized protein n=1 Tax=Fusarium torulosum TaxID=33205 RepID=A0AAE8MNY7_9HYPO|nr:uncharacterized protein FTOL_13842 [Fusarium torulosum]